MRVMSELDRYHLSINVAEAVYGNSSSKFVRKMNEILEYHKDYIKENGEDIEEVRNWKWKKLVE